jgi:hypothetical protein
MASVRSTQGTPVDIDELHADRVAVAALLRPSGDDPTIPVDDVIPVAAPSAKGADSGDSSSVVSPDAEIVLFEAAKLNVASARPAPERKFDVVRDGPAVADERSAGDIVGVARVAAPGAATESGAATALSSAAAPYIDHEEMRAQIVQAVRGLRLRNGVHELRLELRPHDLGHITVDVTVDSGVVHVTMRAELADTNDLLRRNLPELKAAFTDAGVASGHVGVGVGADGSSPRSFRPEPAWDSASSRSGLSVEPAPTPVGTRAGSANAVDLLL